MPNHTPPVVVHAMRNRLHTDHREPPAPCREPSPRTPVPRVIVCHTDEHAGHRLAAAIRAEGYATSEVGARRADVLQVAQALEPSLIVVGTSSQRELPPWPTLAEVMRNYGAQVWMVSERADDRTLEHALRAGCRGFLIVPCSRMQLRAALEVGTRAVSAGQSSDPDSAFDLLSSRELEVYAHLAAGIRVAQVAARLFISPPTVRKHGLSIFKKLGVHSQVELMMAHNAYRSERCHPNGTWGHYT